MKKALVLLSGGLDSTVALAWARERFDFLQPVSVYYGQRHSVEQEHAQMVVEHYKDVSDPIHLNMASLFHAISGSSLTSGTVSGNPSDEPVERTKSALPPTFVPGRNLIMLSAVAALGYTEQAYDIVGGWNAVDYSGYPDCRPEFFHSLTHTLNVALGLTEPEPRFTVHAPLVQLSKEEIIKLGLKLEAPLQLTWSCYAGGDTPCGECDSCKIRKAGFDACGIPDPANSQLSL